MHAASPTALLLLALAAIAVLVALVTWQKFNAFLALLIAALIVGFGAGMPALAALKAFQDGLGATLGGIAAVIALGAILGKLLAESGGAQVLAVACVIALALVVGLVTWFSVGLLLLLPVVVSLAHETRRPFLPLALPLVSFLSVMHALTPPHPGAVVAINALGADNGKVLALAFLAGVPAAWLGGPIFARWIAPRVAVATPALAAAATARPRPGLGATSAVIALPVGLMLAASAAELFFPAGHAVRALLGFVGHPVTALALAVLAALAVFGRAAKFTRAQLLAFTEQSVAGVGMTLLVVGAGGGFALPPLVYGWLIAAFIRVATGSATVAITTAAGLMAPVLASHPELNRELLVLALGFGSLVCSHLNDGGFWIVKDCLGLTVGQTLRTWTVTETIVSVTGLGFTLLLGQFL
jgi:GntP family gluconate:H+ symporter